MFAATGSRCEHRPDASARQATEPESHAPEAPYTHSSPLSSLVSLALNPRGVRMARPENSRCLFETARRKYLRMHSLTAMHSSPQIYFLGYCTLCVRVRLVCVPRCYPFSCPQYYPSSFVFSYSYLHSTPQRSSQRHYPCPCLFLRRKGPRLVRPWAKHRLPAEIHVV